MRGTCTLLNGSFAVRDQSPVALETVRASPFVTCDSNSTGDEDHSHAYLCSKFLPAVLLN